MSEPDLVTCPECEKQGIESRATYEPGSYFTTDMSIRVFDDAEGLRHIHDMNVRSYQGFCEHGHRFPYRKRAVCWCGWPDRKSSASLA